MWILPRNLPTSVFAPDTVALISDSSEQSQACAQSLLVRSKPMPARTWLRKWKRDSWTRHLFGRILKPSRGEDFTAEWTSSLAAIPASHSALMACGSEPATPAIYGRSLQTELGLCAPDTASLRTSAGTFRWDSPQSSAIWKQWVTGQRGACLLRKKLAGGTNAKGSTFSLPTPRAEEYKGVGQMGNKAWCHWISKRYLTPYLHCLHLVWSNMSCGTPMNVAGWMQTAKSFTVPSAARIMRIAYASDLPWMRILIIKRILRGNLRLTPNPVFLEIMMGLPRGWTGCASLETASIPALPNSHGWSFTNA